MLFTCFIKITFFPLNLSNCNLGRETSIYFSCLTLQKILTANFQKAELSQRESFQHQKNSCEIPLSDYHICSTHPLLPLSSLVLFVVYISLLLPAGSIVAHFYLNTCNVWWDWWKYQESWDDGACRLGQDC